MSPDRVIALTFNRLFAPSHNTVIAGGAREPLYLPPGPDARGVIRYTRNYASSALHEISHWCIAGTERRRLVDYGYWYLPPPRSDAEQEAFFAVEARVQALEWLFADAAGVSFHPSADDVHDGDSEIANNTAGRATFAERVEGNVAAWHSQGIPKRANQMLGALAGTVTTLEGAHG
ncbi:MAG: elongation factor P hydroxylase [Gammaproteobacteria bacterium]|nr:elongation factor P hydroxylase [Gammaproteobacteria bacterium]